MPFVRARIFKMSSHFYTRDGKCITGLREARKTSPLPLVSPTTVLGMLTSFSLIRYFKRQMFEAVATTPRDPAWTDDEYFDACERYAEEHGDAARKHGSEFHDLIQSYNLARIHQKPIPHPEPKFEQGYRAYVDWYEANVEKSLLVEDVVIGSGYAGRVDHYCLLKDGRRAVVDAKTQALKGRKKFNHYVTWLLQMGGYSLTDKTKADTMISLCFSSDEPFVFEAYEWPNHPVDANAMFIGLLDIWKIDNNYFPEP